jgi:hypothetical protein
MQGFPLGWTEGLPKTVRKFLLGNAITPQIAKEIYEILAKYNIRLEEK